MNPPLSLYHLAPGESAVIKKLYCSGSIRRRLLDIGMTEFTKVVCVGAAPTGDPKAFLIRGAVIALRREDSINILIEKKEKVNGSC
ncbi:MAG: ferrous iron transport protein A [Lachnospiraceae bacterium]